jgi:hypothetical protein
MRLSVGWVLMVGMGFLAPACASSPTPPVQAAQSEQVDRGNGANPCEEARLVEGVSVLR